MPVIGQVNELAVELGDVDVGQPPAFGFVLGAGLAGVVGRDENVVGVIHKKESRGQPEAPMMAAACRDAIRFNWFVSD